MTDKEKLDKLVAEIERLLNAEEKWMNKQGFTDVHIGMRTGYKNVLSFIDSLQEEPLSEGFEEAIEQSFIYHENRGDDFRCDEQIETSYRYGFEAGANWQKSKDAKLIINAKDDGYRLGLATMKQQLMAKAVDAVVKIDAGGYPYVDATIELYDYLQDIPLAKEGDKYKVVLIKVG